MEVGVLGGVGVEWSGVVGGGAALQHGKQVEALTSPASNYPEQVL